MSVPAEQQWLFWDVDPNRIDLDKDQNFVLPRVLEKGRMLDVVWVVRTYGLDRIHAFLRDVGHPELSPRTLAFWRAFFEAETETWQSPPAWRRTSSAPWHD
jgi:hypothetical protein